MRYSKIKAIIIILILSLSNAANLSFSSSDFTESAEDIINPDQGFYKALKVYLEPNSFRHASGTTEQVYHLRCDISQFSEAVNGDADQMLTETALNGLDNYLTQIKRENKNVVIRFSYDPEYGGNNDKEASLETIRTHIEQLSNILNNHKDTIIAIEAGMLGPWGEMHGSAIATEENKAIVFGYWLENTNGIPIMARTPKAIFAYFGKTLQQMEQFTIEPSNPGYRLGIYNDCYLSSDSDKGTYTVDRTRETQWLSHQNEHVPFGGETCEAHENSNLEFCLPEMRLLKLSYLNGGYNHNVTDDKWKQIQYNSAFGSDDIFYGITAYDYIKRHLGYRLFIKSISVTYEKYGSYTMKIKFGNSGFGNLLKTKKMDIIFTDNQDHVIQRKNVGEYNGSLNLEIRDSFLAEGVSSDYKVYLSVYGSIEDNVVYYPIHFANENIYNNNLKGHFLFDVQNGYINGEAGPISDTNNAKDMNDNVSTDNRCGIYNEKICPNGACCNIYGYCGTSDDFCIKFCVPKYSKCKSPEVEISSNSNYFACNRKIFKWGLLVFLWLL